MKTIKKLTPVLFFALFLFLFQSCEQEPIEVLAETNYLFSAKKELQINTYMPENARFPIFDLSNVNGNLSKIVVLKDSLQLQNNQIINLEDLVWEWDSGMGIQKEIHFEDGRLVDSTFSLGPRFCKLEESNYYWAAWTWNDDGTQIELATYQQTFTVSTTFLPNLVISNIEVTSEEVEDNFLTPGENINIDAQVHNDGRETASDIVIRIKDINSNKEIDTIQKRQLKVGETFAFEFRYYVDDSLQLGNDLPIEIDIEYNGCLSSPTYKPNFAITARQVCLKSITVLDIKSTPPDGCCWDGIFPPQYTNPDLMYYLYKDQEGAIFKSIELNDIDIKKGPARFPSFEPCLPLQMNSLYSIALYDEDNFLISNDDFMGEVNFYPSQFLDSLNASQIIESSSLVLRLDLEWE